MQNSTTTAASSQDRYFVFSTGGNIDFHVDFIGISQHDKILLGFPKSQYFIIIALLLFGVLTPLIDLFRWIILMIIGLFIF